jgi:D-cysteine desulfhydrase
MRFITPIYKIDSKENDIYIKREDLIPYSFGGNKARKAFLFFKEIEQCGNNYVVTYGSGSSNHCRVVANMACERNIPCIIISPQEACENTYNYMLTEMFSAKRIVCPVSEVHQTIENVLTNLKKQEYNPYFIEGGGHGNIGTEAYVQCYNEIEDWEKSNAVKFDYIFFASGTGTTQAGLVCGQLLKEAFEKKIIGISIARKADRGKAIVEECVRSYMGNNIKDKFYDHILFEDKYIGGGYGKGKEEIEKVIESFLIKNGMALDETYTGKAYWGMQQYIKQNKIKGKKILFIHTGGTPLFFDWLERKKKNYDI